MKYFRIHLQCVYKQGAGMSESSEKMGLKPSIKMMGFHSLMLDLNGSRIPKIISNKSVLTLFKIPHSQTTGKFESRTSK